MPELPEVATIVSDLNRTVRGKRITAVWIDHPKLILPQTPRVFERRVRNRVVLSAERRGKYILLTLGKRAGARRKGSGRQLVVLLWHMRMTGHPLFRDEQRESSAAQEAFADPRNQHVRMTFHFSDGTRLDYSDVRRFGTLRLLSPAEVGTIPSLALLGRDALDSQWTSHRLENIFRGRKRALKSLLLDQTLVAGLGNIYVDEALWSARLHPLRRQDTLSAGEYRTLLRSIRSVMRTAIAARGTSIDDFRDLWGRKGNYGERRRVYQRTGQSCFRCGTNIARLVVGGRGTHICPTCQRLRVTKR